MPSKNQPSIAPQVDSTAPQVDSIAPQVDSIALQVDSTALRVDGLFSYPKNPHPSRLKNRRIDGSKHPIPSDVGLLGLENPDS